MCEMGGKPLAGGMDTSPGLLFFKARTQRTDTRANINKKNGTSLRICEVFKMPNQNQQIHGGLIGLLVGDALGVPYEFHDPRDIPRFDLIEYEPPAGFARAHKSTPPGTWSDDGAQAMCLLASLQHHNRLEPQDLAQRFLDWYEHGYLAVDARVFDVGIQTAKSIRAIQAGVPALEAGSNDQYSQGNGSLMRVLPLVLWHQGGDAELVSLAHDQSKITHGHLVCQVCCALYCLWARRILENHSGAWDAALEALRATYATRPEHLAVLEDVFRPRAERNVTGTGFVIDSLFSAKWALEQGDFETVVRAAISLGNDTDTTACIAGGLAGIRDGLEGIPIRWREGLRGQEWLEPLLKTLMR
jgi:ADP-ribosyl-[dinitrogen reductase] hydrolase